MAPHFIWCHSGTGLTRRPFKPEIRGSSPRGITSNYKPTEKRRSMNTGVEIVNALFDHLGMAVSVTAETISEWWPILVSRWAAFEIGTSCIWLALGLVFVIGALITLWRMAHAYTHYQDSRLDYDDNLSGVGHRYRNYFPREAHLRLCNQYAGLKGGHSI